MVNNLYSFIDDRISRFGNESLFELKTLKNEWKNVGAIDFKEQVDILASGFVSLGVKKGDTIAIASPTSYEWILLDFSLLSIGAVPVPIYDSSSSSQIKRIMLDSEISYVFCGNSDIFERVDAVANEIPTLQNVFRIDQNVVDEICDLNDEKSYAAAKKMQQKVSLDDLATIVYTSGSTGLSKGVELTHGNFIYIVNSGLEEIPELLMRDNARLLLFLPLAHVFARYLEYVVVAGTTTLGISPNISTLLADLAKFQPTYLLGVPRIFEKVFNASSQKAGSGISGKIFKDAVKTAIQVSKLQQDHKKPHGVLKAKHRLYSKIVYSKLLHALGGHVEYAVSGGAPIGAELAHFFTGAGLPILEGYGLTETAAPSMVNRVNDNLIGTVGLGLSDAETKISDDGEILIRSKSVMRGYHNMPEETALAIQDGWLYTGDIGEILPSGHVRITGRKKDLIVTAGGKNVSPALLEESVKTSPIVDGCVVVGDKKPFVAALITLDADNLKYLLQQNNLSDQIGKNFDIAKVKNNPVVCAEINRVIAKTNRLVSKAESIRKYLVLDEGFTEENGMLTPSLKIKRLEVIKHYEKLIDQKIYNA